MTEVNRRREGGHRVTVVTTVHPWDDVRIFHKGCKTLAAAGYQVELLAPGEGVWEEGGVTVRGMGLAQNRAERIFTMGRRVYRRVMREGGAVIHGHDPELLPLLLLARVRGRKSIYDAHEDLSRQVLSKHWIPSGFRFPTARAAGTLVPAFARRLDAVVAATPRIAEQFGKGQVALVRNFPLRGELTAGMSRAYRDRPPHAAYVGGLTVIRGAQEMARAACRVQIPGFQLRIAGDISPPSLRRKVLATCPSGIQMEGMLDRPALAKLLGGVRVGLVTLHPTPSYVDALPVKLFEYMAAGIPVVASDFPTWRQIVEGAGCGLLVDPTDAGAIAEAITWLLESPDEAEAMGRRGQEAVEKKYNWEQESKTLLHVYKELLA